VSDEVNPYESPSAANEKPLPVFENGEFLVDGLTIIGGDEIRLPPVCAVSGSRDDVELHTTKLRRQSLGDRMLYALALVPMIGVFFWSSFLQQNTSLAYRPYRLQLLAILLSAFIGFSVYSFNPQKHRITTLYWYRTKKELRVYRTYQVVLTLLCVLLILVGAFSRGLTTGTLPFVAVIAIVYSKKRFVSLKMISRRGGISRIVGFKPAFFKAIRVSNTEESFRND
jgi:hypothetical protein